ncbi:hypothetical protein FT993_03860, partial [Mesonia sp. HuA40]
MKELSHISSKITLLLLFWGSLILHAQTVAIPDVNFEQFLIAQGIDTNGQNGNILTSDAQAITTLDITVSTVTDLTGINAFSNLTQLDVGDNAISNINLTALMQLEQLTIDGNSALTSIDLSQNTLLESLVLKSPNFGSAMPLTALDLSSNNNLLDVEMYRVGNLSNLVLPSNPILLTNFKIINHDNTALNFANFDSLENLHIQGGANGLNITLPNIQTNLKEIYISSIGINNVDVSAYSNLEKLSLFNVYLQTLSLPSTNTFTQLTIWHHNFIAPLDLSSVPNLIDLDIRFNQSAPLIINLVGNPNLENVWLTHNDLNAIDFTHNTLLKNLRIYDNNLSVLDVTQNNLLERLDANNNQIPAIDLSQNQVLHYLNLSNNLLPTIDLTSNIELTSINLSHNLFTTTGTDLTQNIDLSSLNFSHNQISSLDITQNSELRYLVLSHNLFTSNSILYDFENIRASNGDILGGKLDVSFNQISGSIPDFASLIHTGAGGQNDYTRYFELNFNNNNFEFGDFENQHAAYLNFTTLTSPPPFNTVVMREYHYAPQAKVNTILNPNINAGDDITLSTIVSGAQNHYQWFKDGNPILGAPDSPYYTIYDATGCDAGVYHCEVTSDLVPFENANPPGTNNRNLLLIRNDITLSVNTSESCVSLSYPLDGAINVPVNGNIIWNDNPSACGYFLTAGTTSGGSNIYNNIDVGDVNSYPWPTNLPANTTIYITLTPYFESGNILNCTEESFTTNTDIVLPNCTNLKQPLNAATNVSINSSIIWDPALNASGYLLSLGTNPGGTSILNNQDVGNVTSFTPTNPLPSNTTIYVSITPYNSAGNASACTEESFTTETIVVVPSCTSLSNPLNAATNVSVNTAIDWNAITEADGYLLSLGTNPGGTSILNNQDVGNVTSFSPANPLPSNTTIYVSITPYNSAGNASACAEESFTTETIVVVPNCTSLSNPLNTATNVSVNTAIDWNAITEADGYLLSLGTNPGGTSILNNQDVGNVTSFTPTNPLPSNTTIYVSITPYNSAGNASACTEESFTTETIVVVPNCTSLSNPLNAATNVSVNTAIDWNAITEADGYLLSLGTNPGGTSILNNQDVGNVTSFTPANPLPSNTTIYVSITPYNSAGNASACAEESFTTETIV